MSKLDIRKLFVEGGNALKKKHSDGEVAKLGTLRVGNTGLFDKETGSYAGKCARQTLLRYQGYEIEEEDESGADQTLMFEAGFKNEDSWLERMKESWDGVIKCEEEVPVEWLTKSGIRVTGRPDMVLCDRDGTPVHMLEHKLICSMWTARDVLAGFPKLPHVAQAAHYSLLLNIPATLCYTSRVDYGIMGFAQKNFPTINQQGSQYCEYNDKGVIKKVRPFMKPFTLEWNDDGTLDIIDYDTQERKRSIVSKSRILDYFESVVSTEGSLPARPADVTVHGDKLNYEGCSYCSMKNVCDKFETDRERWQDEAHRLFKKIG